MTYKKPKKRRMKKLRIDELSLVDVPAQTGARSVIMKRGESDGDDVRKSHSVMTSDSDGHSHRITLYDFDGNGGDTSYSTSLDDDHGHTHPWVYTPEDGIVIGMSEGHTHTVSEEMIASISAASIFKSTESPETQRGTPMTEKNKSKADDTVVEKSEHDKVVKELAYAKAWGELNDESREYAKGLSDEDRNAFVFMSAEDRAAAVQKAQESREVVYKALDGSEYTKDDDPRMVNLAKRNDELERSSVIEKARREEQEFQKTASEELSNLQGDIPAKALIVKALSKQLKEDEFNQAMEILKGANRVALKTIGVADGQINKAADGSADAAEFELRKRADEIVKADQEMSWDEAFAKACEEDPKSHQKILGL